MGDASHIVYGASVFLWRPVTLCAVHATLLMKAAVRLHLRLTVSAALAVPPRPSAGAVGRETMSGRRQVFRTLASGALSVALVFGLTRLVTDVGALLAIALVLQALLIGYRVWRHRARLLQRRQQAGWDAEWDRAWAEQDARVTHLAARPGSAGLGMRVSSQPLGILAALSAARDVLEQYPQWRIVSIQVDTHDATYRHYHLTICHELTGALRFIYTPQDWATLLREMREIRQTIPQPGSGRGGEQSKP